MLGGQRRAETLAHRSAVLLPHPMQHPAPKFLPIAAVGSAPRAAVLQTCRTFLAIALPQPLGLAITDVQQPARIDDPQLPTAHSRQHFDSSQFLLTHLCPPQSAFSKLFKSTRDWNYSTEEEPCLNGRRLYWPRGKMLGGSSSMNAMIYIRGNPSDYESWETLGNEGWGWADVLPYFKKSENQERGESQFHGAGGPMNVCDLRYVNELTRAFLAGALETGIRANEDFNGAAPDGVGLYQVTQKNGARQSAADAYLKPVLRRRNLKVLTGAHATRVIIENNRARGVAYVRNRAMEEA